MAEVRFHWKVPVNVHWTFPATIPWKSDNPLEITAEQPNPVGRCHSKSIDNSTDNPRWFPRCRSPACSERERLVEYCWNSTVWNLEVDEAVPPCDRTPPVFHAYYIYIYIYIYICMYIHMYIYIYIYINKLRPVIGLFEPTNLDEVPSRIPPTSQSPS